MVSSRVAPGHGRERTCRLQQDLQHASVGFVDTCNTPGAVQCLPQGHADAQAPVAAGGPGGGTAVGGGDGGGGLALAPRGSPDVDLDALGSELGKPQRGGPKR